MEEFNPREIDWTALGTVLDKPKFDPAIALQRKKIALAKKYLALKQEGLALYEPIWYTEPFHACNALWRVVGDSNRSLGGCQKIYDPVTKQAIPVSKIRGKFHVLSRNPSTGSYEVTLVDPPFIKSHSAIYRFVLSNGETLDATMQHRVLDASRKWISMEEAIKSRSSLLCAPCREGVPEYHIAEEHAEPYRSSTPQSSQSQWTTFQDQYTSGEFFPCQGKSVVAASRPRISVSGLLGLVALVSHKGGACCADRMSLIQDSLGGCQPYSRLCDEQLHRILSIDLDVAPLQDDAARRIGILNSQQTGAHDRVQRYSHDTSLRHLTTSAQILRNKDQFFSSFFHICELAARSYYLRTHKFQQFSERSYFHQSTCETNPLCSGDSFFQSYHPSFFKWSVHDRQCSIVSYEKIEDNGDVWDISVEPHANYLASSLSNANSGKSLACYGEDARAITGSDPYKKYPQNNGYAMFVGLKLDHIAQMYRGLFRPGLFKKIRDEHSGLWRAVRWDRDNPKMLQPYDEAYREKWVDAPPLVPERFVKHIDWETSGEVPRHIQLVNGWRLIFLSALGNPEQGAHYSLVHFDEEMPNPEFYVEAHRGLTRLHETWQQRPKAIWSATSQVANVELAELRDRAEREPDSDFVRRFTFLIEDNPYVSLEAKREFKEGLSEEDQLTRYHGIPSSQVRRIYPKYNPMGNSEDGTGHGCEPFDIDPALYTRYVIVDPSVRHCATLFVAVDPLEQYATIYDGFDLSGATSTLWAAEVKEREKGHKFELIIFDQQMGKESQIGREKTTVAREYFKSVVEAGIQIRQQGPLQGFFPGCNDVDARTQSLLRLMEVRGSGPFEGTCKLRVMRGILPELDKQIRRAQTDPKNPTKRLKNPKVPSDYLDCAEYAASSPLLYYPIEKISKEVVPPVFAHFKEKQMKKRRRQQAEMRRITR